ncbi:MAG: methyltransferase domain-containing protein [Bryobacteraceae bacterium]|jgi:SAM-dependent methyltransferase
MKLRAQQKHWDRLAREDPFWAILTDPAKRHGGWDAEQFFSTGRDEIASAMQYAESLGLPAGRGHALDFGCGAGRLTQALAGYFDRVTGVDISPAMIELARQYNRAGERCACVVNGEEHLRQFADGSFDLIYSRIVLQHLPARQARRYIREFVRLLRPRGLALFQLPARLASPRLWSRIGFHLNLWTRRILRQPHLIEMYGVPCRVVRRDLEECGGRLVDVQPDSSAGPEWESWRYAVSK